MLKQRIITAIILIPITLALLFYLPPLAFCYLTAFIALAGAWEWSNLMGVKDIPLRVIYVVIMACMFFIALFISSPFIFLCAFAWWLLATVLIIFYPRGKRWWGNSVLIRALMGVFVLVPCWVAINYMRIQPDGVYSILFLFVLIWGADSAAYFVGKKWGKTKLSPQVSPGKSLQGAVGALIFSMLIALITLWLTHAPLQIWHYGIVLSFITVIFSIIGDLFESMLKRQVNLKDSGQLLPGHGGLLDRIDSLTAAAPVFALGAVLLGIYLSNASN